MPYFIYQSKKVKEKQHHINYFFKNRKNSHDLPLKNLKEPIDLLFRSLQNSTQLQTFQVGRQIHAAAGILQADSRHEDPGELITDKYS